MIPGSAPLGSGPLGDSGVTSGAPAGDQITAALAIRVFEIATHAALLTIRVVSGTDQIQAGTSIRVFSAGGQIQAGLAIQVLNPATAYAPLLRWSAIVRVKGVDLTSRVTGKIEIDAEEGAARVATFALLPPVGAVAVSDFLCAPITIDVNMQDSTGVTRNVQRLFTGLVEVPEYDPVTRITRMRCTDALQDSLATTPRPLIDALLPGSYYSTALFDSGADILDVVQNYTIPAPSGPYTITVTPPLGTFWNDLIVVDGKTGVAMQLINSGTPLTGQYKCDVTTGTYTFAAADFSKPVQINYSYSIPSVTGGWQYAKDRSGTIPVSVDATPWAQPRATSWAAKTTQDLSYDTSNIIDGSLAVQFARRSDLRNQITVTYTYRHPRLKRRVVYAGYGYPFSYSEIFQHGYSQLTRDMVRQAVTGTGWELLGDITFVPRQAGPFVLTGLGFDTTPAAVADLLCMGFDARLQKRYAQGIDEQSQLTVRCQPSIDKLGRIADTKTAKLECTFDTKEWEKVPPAFKAGSEVVIGEPLPKPPIVSTISGEAYVDYTFAARATRADSDNAINTAIAQAQTAIRLTHRRNVVKFKALIDPRLDLDKTIRVATSLVTAKGKVRRVVHQMDIDAGSAISAVEIAISATTATGTQPYTAPVPPIQPVPPAPTGLFSTTTSTYVGRTAGSGPLTGTEVGYFTNVSLLSTLYSPSGVVYPTQFVLEAPAIPTLDRSPRTITTYQTYETSVPEDELTMSA